MDTTNWLVTLAQYVLRKQLAHSRWQYLQLQNKLEVAEYQLKVTRLALNDTYRELRHERRRLR